MKDKHIGSSFDDFLQEEGLMAEAEATALKRILAYQISQEMELCNIKNCFGQNDENKSFFSRQIAGS